MLGVECHQFLAVRVDRNKVVKRLSVLFDHGDIEPLGAFKGWAVAGCEPDEMGIGPIYAVPKLLKRHGLTVDDIDTTIEAEPTSIVSISPTGTEMLFAIGAGDQVVAVDDFSYFPEEAPVTDLSGNDPNIEAILSYEPDLVVMSGDRNDVGPALADVGVPSLVLSSAQTFDDTYGQIEVLGAATGHVGDAGVDEGDPDARAGDATSVEVIGTDRRSDVVQLGVGALLLPRDGLRRDVQQGERVAEESPEVQGQRGPARVPRGLRRDGCRAQQQHGRQEQRRELVTERDFGHAY